MGPDLSPELHPPAATILRAARLPESKSVDGGAVFIELFAGAGGLTLAINKLKLPTLHAMDVAAPSGDVEYEDLRKESTYRKYLDIAKSGKVRWMHGAPPCKTFSRARRRDRYGSAAILRSDQFPQGLPGKRNRLVVEGNLLAMRYAKIVRCVHRAGGWWSLENPARSFMWA
jgi:hypothetical protein